VELAGRSFLFADKAGERAFVGARARLAHELTIAVAHI
jgi:hypothetical protein